MLILSRKAWLPLLVLVVALAGALIFPVAAKAVPVPKPPPPTVECDGRCTALAAANGGGGGSSGKKSGATGVLCIQKLGCHGEDWIYVSELERAGYAAADFPGCLQGVYFTCLNGLVFAVPEPSRDEVTAWAWEVVFEMGVPSPAIRIGPDPSVNEWNMAVVGLPIWIWSDEAVVASRSMSAHGHPFSFTARRVSVDFDFGDATRISCPAMSVYPGESALGMPSPNCGHTYSKPSLPQGAYTVAATAHWEVEWAAAGYSGTIPMTLTQSRQLRVGELQAVTTKR